MSGFDRSRFKGSKVSSMKETIKDAETKSGYSNKGYHNIDAGINIFRIAPPHNPEDPPFQPFRSTFLKCEVPKKDSEGNDTEEMEMRIRRIFIATIHGLDVDGKPLTKDPIEMYVDRVYAIANEIKDKDTRKKFLYPITGWKAGGKWNPGIQPRTNYVAYAWKDGLLGKIELYSSVVKKMEELNIAEAANEPIEVDIFSDPDDGVSLVIDYNREADSNSKYTVSKREWDFNKYLKKYGREEAMDKWENDRKVEVLTNEQLMELAKKPSLKSDYYDNYTIRDFELAINGLKVFDETNSFNIFDDEEFLEELNELEKKLKPYVSQQDKNEAEHDKDNPLMNKEAKNKNAVPKSSKPNTDQQEDVAGEEDYSVWPLIKLRKKITAYILENYGNDYVMPKLNKDEMIEWAKLVDAEEELPFDDYKEDDEPAENEESKESESENETQQEEQQSKKSATPEKEDKTIKATTAKGLNPAVADKINALRNKKK